MPTRPRAARNTATRFSCQEPDIKNGVGGLRDYQNALWMARVKLGIEHMEELHTLNYLRRKELADFQRGYNFLLRVRNELHFTNKHPTDLLDLEMQARVAQHLGYRQQNPLQRVEDFMADYYRQAQAIHRISKIVENRLALAIKEDGRFAAFLPRDAAPAPGRAREADRRLHAARPGAGGLHARGLPG